MIFRKWQRSLTTWLETRWVNPAYSGWLLLGLMIFFFAAATNTMAGWLYVISGGLLSLLTIAIMLPERTLRSLTIERAVVHPVSVGGSAAIELRLNNPSSQPKMLLEIQDSVPTALQITPTQTIDSIPPQDSYLWRYDLPASRRGIYHWHTIQLRTAAPLGLFWRRRSVDAGAQLIIYPEVFSLSHCPLIDELGLDTHPHLQYQHNAVNASDGLTRALRPYRWGDPIRLVHWRTSARYGELRVRELEVLTSGQAVVIALDSAIAWDLDEFEVAVTAAASLYFYAVQQGLQVSLWTAATGAVQGDQRVMETLAGVQAGETPTFDIFDSRMPMIPLIWHTCNPERLRSLPAGSRWLLWHSQPIVDAATPDAPMSSSRLKGVDTPGLWIQPNQSLVPQLQAPIQTN